MTSFNSYFYHFATHPTVPRMVVSFLFQSKILGLKIEEKRKISVFEEGINVVKGVLQHSFRDQLSLSPNNKEFGGPSDSLTVDSNQITVCYVMLKNSKSERFLIL